MKPERSIKRIDQVCLVVRDFQKTIEHYWNSFGIGPWKIVLLEERVRREMTIKRIPAKYRIYVAMCQLENIYFEVIQPLSGDTAFEEFLEQKGEGLHHLGFFVEDLDLEMKRLETKGFGTVQSGRFQGGGFSYLDTQEEFGTILEIIERSKPRNIPIRVWPEDEDV